MDFQEFRRPFGGCWEPNADLVIDEAGGRVVVRVELAGVEPESLRAFLDERHLLISGRRADTMRLRDGSLLQKEIPDGEFIKKLHLPVSVQYGEVTATYVDGMLTIALALAATEYIPVMRAEILVKVKRILA